MPDRGISITRMMGWDIPFPTPQTSENNGPIYKIQTVFDRSGKFMEGNLKLLTSGSPMMSQVMPKSNCLTIWRIWFCRELQPYEIEISQYIGMDRVWDTPKCHPKLSGSIFNIKVIQGHEIKQW